MKRVAFYLRVSTSEQTTSNQRQELEAVAQRHGWDVVACFEDAGVSGAKGREKRPGLNSLLKGIARREFDLIAAWSVDRLGRSLQDLLALLNEVHAKGVDLYLHQQGLDTSTPAGKALFQMMGVFAEFERAMIQERIKAGLARVRSEGIKLGRPRISQSVEDAILSQLEAANAPALRKIALCAGAGVSAVQRIINDGVVRHYDRVGNRVDARRADYKVAHRVSALSHGKRRSYKHTYELSDLADLETSVSFENRADLQKWFGKSA